MFEDGQIVVCGECNKEFAFEEWDTELFDGKPICFTCYDNKYSHCDCCSAFCKYDECFTSYKFNLLCKKCAETRGVTEKW